MDVSSILGPGLLQSVSPTTEAKPLQQAAQLPLNGPDPGSAASAQPASDTYTPSSQSQPSSTSVASFLAPTAYQYTMQLPAPKSDPNAGGVNLTVSSYVPAGIPPAPTSDVVNAVTPELAAWEALAQSQASGDVSEGTSYDWGASANAVGLVSTSTVPATAVPGNTATTTASTAPPAATGTTASSAVEP
jgi:hypothetical protein